MTSRLKDSTVALLVNMIPPYRVQVLKELADRVQRLVVLTSVERERNRDWIVQHDGLEVLEQRTWTFLARRKNRAGFRSVDELHIPWNTQRQLASIRPDLVISGELGARTALAARYCIRSRTPLIIWGTLSQETELGRGITRALLRRQLVRAATGFAVNGRSGATYLETLGVRPQHVTAIGQAETPEVVGLDPADLESSRRRSNAATDGLIRMLFVGRMTGRKGLRQLGCAFAGLHQSKKLISRYSITFIGPKAPEDDASSVVGELDALEGVSARWLGSLPPSGLAEHYRAADVLVLPTLADEWGLVVNEALAAGLAILGSTRSQAVAELVTPLVGWVYDPTNPTDFSRALLEMDRASPSMISSMQQNSIELSRYLTTSRMVDRLTGALQAALDRHGERHAQTEGY